MSLRSQLTCTKHTNRVQVMVMGQYILHVTQCNVEMEQLQMPDIISLIRYIHKTAIGRKVVSPRLQSVMFRKITLSLSTHCHLATVIRHFWKSISSIALYCRLHYACAIYDAWNICAQSPMVVEISGSGEDKRKLGNWIAECSQRLAGLLERSYLMNRWRSHCAL